MPPKRVYPWKPSYAHELGLRVTSRDGITSKVTGVVCRFCENFGRELSEVDAAERKRRKTTKHLHFKGSFRTNNIRAHMLEQHPMKFNQYLALRNSRDCTPEALEAFFSQVDPEAPHTNQDAGANIANANGSASITDGVESAGSVAAATSAPVVLQTQTTNDLFRLMNVVFDDEFVTDLCSFVINTNATTNTAASIISRSSGGVANKRAFWKSVRQKFMANDPAIAIVVHLDDRFQDVHPAQFGMNYTANHLKVLWMRLVSDYRPCFANFAERGKSYIFAFANELDFFQFCKGRPELLYLHYWLQQKPFVVDSIVSHTLASSYFDHHRRIDTVSRANPPLAAASSLVAPSPQKVNGSDVQLLHTANGSSNDASTYELLTRIASSMGLYLHKKPNPEEEESCVRRQGFLLTQLDGVIKMLQLLKQDERANEDDIAFYTERKRNLQRVLVQLEQQQADVQGTV